MTAASEDGQIPEAIMAAAKVDRCSRVESLNHRNHRTCRPSGQEVPAGKEADTSRHVLAAILRTWCPTAAVRASCPTRHLPSLGSTSHSLAQMAQLALRTWPTPFEQIYLSGSSSCRRKRNASRRPASARSSNSRLHLAMARALRLAK